MKRFQSQNINDKQKLARDKGDSGKNRVFLTEGSKFVTAGNEERA